MMMLTGNDLRKVERIVAEYEGKLDLSVQISADEFKVRQRRVQDELKKRDIDLGVFFWYREMPGDGIYLTGYNPTIERASGLIGREGEPVVLGGPEAGKMAEEVAPRTGVKVEFAKEFQIPDEYYEGVVYRPLREIFEEVGGGRIKRLGVLTSFDLIPVELFEIFKRSADKDVEIVDATDVLRNLRYEKSEDEFRCMEQADVIASAALRAMLAVLRPGLRETQISAVGDFVIKSLGGEGYGVETSVLAGQRCRTVIAPAGNFVIREGQIVQLGCSPSYEGYKGVARRTVVVGKPTDRQERFLEILSEGYARAEEALREVVEKGIAPKYIDLAARNFFSQHEIDGLNLRRFHLYSSAHGTGLTECLEPKVIGPDTEEAYGNRVGIMLDVGLYGHPNDEIAGGAVESAFGKDGDKLLAWTDLPVRVEGLVGGGLD